MATKEESEYLEIPNTFKEIDVQKRPTPKRGSQCTTDEDEDRLSPPRADCGSGAEEEDAGVGAGAGAGEQTTAAQLTAAQRARIERNRLRARALQDARLVRRPDLSCSNIPSRAVDSGGGFLIEDEEEEPPPVTAAPHAPLLDPTEQPCCLLCEKLFPQSYLFDTFDYSVCDACRDDEEEHDLITRTEAKSEFLLKDCDLDAREPPLRCVRRRNPHRAASSDMRLYLRKQVEERALLVWGSRAAVAAERARRADARAAGRRRQAARRLRALRMDVRSSLYDRTSAAHAHAHSYGPERALGDDVFERACLTCDHRETYEKM